MLTMSRSSPAPRPASGPPAACPLRSGAGLKRRRCEQLGDGLMLVGEVRYFLYTATSGGRWLVRADCPHRGGPLNFAEYDPERNALRCPWHKLLLPERALLARSAPAVRVRGEWTAVVADVPGCGHRKVSSSFAAAETWTGGQPRCDGFLPAKRPRGQSMVSPAQSSALPLLRNRNFSIYLGGQLVSYTFTWVQVVALSWAVLQTTASPLAVGGVTAAATLPALFISPLAGAIADRMPKRKMLMLIQAGRALASLSFGAAIFAGAGLASYLALALVIGILTAIDTPIRQAFMYELSGRLHVAEAVTLNELAFNIGRVLSGPICGLLLTTLGAASCFALNAAAYLVVLAGLVFITEPAAVSINVRSSPVGLFGNLRFALSDRRMIFLFVSLAIYSVSTLNHIQLFTIYVKLSLEADADALGQFVGWLGAGALTSAIALVWMNRAQAHLLYLSAAVLPSCFVILASTQNVWIADLVGCLFGLALVQYLVRMSVLLQTVVAPENRGSVTGLYSMCLIGATPVSVLFSGALAQYLDVNAALRIGAGLALVGFIFLIRAAPASRLYAHSNPVAGA